MDQVGVGRGLPGEIEWSWCRGEGGVVMGLGELRVVVDVVGEGGQ